MTSNKANLELKQIFDELSKTPNYNLIYSEDGNTLIKAFAQNLHSISNLTIPNYTFNIGERAFFENKNLCSIVLPEGLKTIDKYAFYNCSNLSSINIPESVISIREMAFYRCVNLNFINIPEGTHIGENAFYLSGIDLNKAKTL